MPILTDDDIKEIVRHQTSFDYGMTAETFTRYVESVVMAKLRKINAIHEWLFEERFDGEK